MLGLAQPPGTGDALVEALARADCHVALRGGSIRISPHLHNTPDEVETLIGALEVAIRG